MLERGNRSYAALNHVTIRLSATLIPTSKRARLSSSSRKRGKGRLRIERKRLRATRKRLRTARKRKRLWTGPKTCPGLNVEADVSDKDIRKALTNSQAVYETCPKKALATRSFMY